VKLLKVNPKLPHCTHHDFGEQGGAIGVEEFIERAPDAVIVEERYLRRAQT
jgi:hypothetical protein